MKEGSRTVGNRVASRFGLIEESATFAVADSVKRLKAAGETVYDLGGGDPDFPTAKHIADAADAAMREGFTHYVASKGIPTLLEAICEKLERDNGLRFDPRTDVIVTPSAKHALYIALLTILDPGDQIIVPTPSWVSYEAIVRLMDAEPVLAALDPRDGFRITRELLETYVTPRTKALLVNTPNNPTGRVLTDDEAAAILAFAQDHDLILVADEIYEKIIYDDGAHLSLGAYPGAENRTITINGFSKAYAMTGWRLGYLAGPADIIAEAVKAQQHTVGCAGSFVQRGGLAALRGEQAVVDRMRDEYARRRQLIVEGLRELPGIECAFPEGAFYVFPDVSRAGFSDSVEFTQWLLQTAKVAVTPGTAFGPGGESHVRMSFANSQEEIASALKSMRSALDTAAASV